MVKIRRAYEALFLGLFLFFLIITDLRYLKGWPVSLFLEATPLVAVSTALTTHTLYRNLVWGLVIVGVTMMLGGVWGKWMCPSGILHPLCGWTGNRRNTKQMIEVNRYRKIYAIKYYILAAMIAMAALWIVPTALATPGKVLAAYSRLGGREALPLVASVFALAGMFLLASLRWTWWFALFGGLQAARPRLIAILKIAATLCAVGAVGAIWLSGPRMVFAAVGQGVSEAAEEHKV